MTNYSILSLSFYYGVVFGAHGYSRRLVAAAERKSGTKAYDNSNPRAANSAERIKALLGPGGYGRWERVRAAHNNGLESFPLAAAALLACHQAGMAQGFQNAVGAVVLASRVAYTLLYIGIEGGAASYWRTAAWGVGMLTSLYALARAGLRTAGIVD